VLGKLNKLEISYFVICYFCCFVNKTIQLTTFVILLFLRFVDKNNSVNRRQILLTNPVPD